MRQELINWYRKNVPHEDLENHLKDWTALEVHGDAKQNQIEHVEVISYLIERPYTMGVEQPSGYHEKVKQTGFDIIGRTIEDETPEGQTFDRIVGQAAICGTLTVANLLQFIRPYIVQEEVPNLDCFAHMMLEL